MRASMYEQMSIFVEVAERGSFARAADVLHLHRPAVTKAIQQLEEELGTRLGVRLENGNYPTLRLFFVQCGVDCA